LKGALDELHAERHVGVAPVQAADDLELRQVMVVTRMRLSDRHHACVGQSIDEGVEIEAHAATVVDARRTPRARGNVRGARRRCRIIDLRGLATVQ